MFKVKFDELKVQNSINPLGIDETHPVFSWIVTSDQPNKYQTAYQLQVATSIEQLLENRPDLWDCEKVKSPSSSNITYRGKALENTTRYFWRVKLWDEGDYEADFSPIAIFETAFLNPEAFVAKWIAGTQPRTTTLGKGMAVEHEDAMPPKTIEKSLPVFAKAFSLDETKAIVSARAYVSGLGMFALEINDQKASENWFEPGETDYGKEILYVTYDITALLNNGPNAMGATLGKGYYLEDGDGKYKKLYPNYGELMFKAQLEIKYDDATTQTILTDESFLYNEDGPIKISSWTGGEDYNANAELGPYSTPGYDYSHWHKVRIVQPTAERLMAKTYNPIVVSETFKAVRVEEIDAKTFLVDFGRNFAGVPQFKLEAPKGTRIELWPSELLNKGRVDQCSTGTPIWDSYIFKGSEKETWSPQFCYHGFRYMEVRVTNGTLTKPKREMFTALLLCCANEKTGEFETSNNNYNVIHLITNRSVEANMFNTLTDCPHREKLGWQEVPHLMFNSITPNYDVLNWMKKIANDTITAQHDSGLVPDICPEFVRFANGFLDDPTWGGSCILIPYHLYITYGDTQQLSQSYRTMIKYMDYLESKSTDHLLNHGLGDWGGYDTSTPLGLAVSCTYFMLAKTLGEIAQVLHKAQDSQKYSVLATKIRNSINHTYLDKETLCYGSNSQGSNAMPLFYGIVEDGHKQQVLKNLLQSIKKETYHITTGEISLKPMIMALSDNGFTDVVLEMLLNKTMPSYLHFVENNATALPEFWDMQASQLHCMMGHVEGWFYEHLAGIRNTSVAYKTFEIKPYIPENIDHLKAKIKSIYGDIVLNWEKQTNGSISMNIDVPVNTTATIVLDFCEAHKITIEPAAQDKVINANLVAYIVGSGKYHIVINK